MAHTRFHSRHVPSSASTSTRSRGGALRLPQNYIWWVREALDLRRMERRLTELTGLRDFSAFADKRRDEGESGKVMINASACSCRITCCSESRARTSCGAWSGASSACWSRWAREAPDHPSKADPRPRSHLPQLTAPSASGLFLERVRYEGDPPAPP